MNIYNKYNYSTTNKMSNKVINKGTGAGGAKTTENGKKFEDITDNELRLIEKGYEKIMLINDKDRKTFYFLSKTFEDKKIIFLKQSGFTKYFEEKYNIELFRKPDEAYIIEYNDKTPKLLILEKKNQNMPGSVDTKLLAGPLFKEEYYEALEGKFEIEYGFCVSSYLQKIITSSTKKYIIFNKLMERHNIPILFGDDENYFETLEKWISNF